MQAARILLLGKHLLVLLVQMVGLLLYQGLQVVFVVQDLLEVLAHGCNYSFIVFVALLEGFILLPNRFKFLLDLI